MAGVPAGFRARCVTALCCLSVAAAGCNPPGGGHGEGPGHRAQSLALTPHQEASLGEQAYREVLAKSHPVSGPDLERIKRIGERIAKAAAIEPLQREINLRYQGYQWDWEYSLLRDDQVNAFCLPGGKIAVYTGLLNVAKTDDQLATVLGHEIAHALAHHASERIAREQMYEKAVNAVNGAFGGLGDGDRKKLAGLLGVGFKAGGLAYDRQQESEADHIGLFLMTFAGYDPDEALTFWEAMSRHSGGHPPEILSDHPSDAHRIAQLRQWVPKAKAALQAYKSGHVAPAGSGGR
jgi:predicted Zn-dependent protease